MNSLPAQLLSSVGGVPLNQGPYLTIKKAKPVTCIIGLRCKDGVVLAGDRKVKKGIETRFEKKIKERDIYLVGAAGYVALSDEFYDKVDSELKKLSDEGKVLDETQFKDIVKRKMGEIYDTYYHRYKDSNQRILDVLLAYNKMTGTVKPKSVAVLNLITQEGTCSEIREREVIGAGQWTALPFIAALYHRDMTVNQGIRLVVFTLTLFERLHILEDAVGGRPQIYYLLDDMGGFTELKEEKIDEKLRENEELFKRFSHLIFQ